MKTTLVRVLVLVAAMVPLNTWAATPLRVGSDISYAPLEFYSGPAKRVEGFDYDLAQAISTKLGMPLRFRDHDFNGLIPSLRSGTFDLVISAMSDTRARSKQIDFVDYFLAGSGMLVKAGNPHHIFNLASLCGMTVDLEAGTSQDSAVQAQSKQCVQIGLHAITIKAYPTDDAALQYFLTGASAAHISDYPVVAHLARTLEGGKHYAVAGRQFDVTPYGIGVAKANAPLRERVRTALKAVIASGQYDHLLQKWGLQQGAMRSAPVNAGTKFE